jgi:CelD/BcsL family acetyltransferase involved in cellulose biosynthesis
VRGILPLAATRGLPFMPAAIAGKRVCSLPRTPVAGPLADDDDAAAALVAAAIARTPPGARLQLKVAGPQLDGLVPGLEGHAWRATYVRPLPGRPDALRFGSARNHSRIRWAVNKALKESVRLREATTEQDVRAWYPLYLATMRRHIVPPRSIRMFLAMLEHMRPVGTMRLYLAERDDRVIAGSVFLALGETLFYAFNGVRADMLGLRPNDLLQWQALRDACAEGRRWYDLGEVVEQHEGLAAFKRKWGTEERRLYRYYHPPPEARPDPGDGPCGPLRRAAEGAWRRMPLPLTAVVGAHVCRYL